MTDHERSLAFPGGAPETFVGNWPQLMAIASAAGVRNSMEDHHAGMLASPDAKVTWPGGECLYGEAARLSRSRFNGFERAVTKKIAQDLHRASTPPARWSAETTRSFTHSINCAHNWYLPRQAPDLTRDLMGAIRDALPRDALRKHARSVATLHAALRECPAFTEPLSHFTIGNDGPARAFDRGKTVMVETEHGPTPWAGVSHMSDAQMKAFNIGMSDYILSAYEAMENVAFERPARRTVRVR